MDFIIHVLAMYGLYLFILDLTKNKNCNCGD